MGAAPGRGSAGEAREVVLVGGGHAHLEVLRRFGMDPPPGARITLVSRETEAVYSGMLPGTLAGHYRPDEGRIDLRPLARFAGARLLHAEAVGLDPERRLLELAGRPPLPYDLLSLDVGAAPDVRRVPGASDLAVPVKPIDRFLRRWKEVERRLAEGRRGRIAVVGGGAGGVEIVLALDRRFRSGGGGADLLLLTASDAILPEHPRGARRRVRRALAARGVEVRTGARVARVERDGSRIALRLDDDAPGADARGEDAPGDDAPGDDTSADDAADRAGAVRCDEVVWVTSAAAPGWPRDAGLATDADGFVLVDDALRSLSHPEVFAAGDVATMRRHPRPKAGVIAVRQGPPLAENLRRVLAGRAPRAFRPQRTFLTILSTGGRHAVASRGPVVVEGDWVWRLKDWIDRRWIRKYTELPEMGGGGAAMGRRAASRRGAGAPEAADSPMRCAGCGGKVGGAVLSRVLEGLSRSHPESRPEVVAGLEAPDDAAVLRTRPGHLQVQSIDFFRDPLGDPYLLGRIAAIHALGDLHAMGAEPVSALALIQLPHGSDAAVEGDLRQVLAGAERELAAVGAALVGGHTAEGDSLSAGFAVTGTAEEGALTRKGALRPGEVLVLTEPLGTGVVLAAEMRGRARSAWVDEALEGMLRSCGPAASVLHEHGAGAVTDVTGFGLAGHLLEMLRASNAGARVELARLPLLDGAVRAAADGVRSTLHAANVEAAADIAWDRHAATDPRAFALHDPQTAGGLLAGIPESRAEACVEGLREAGYPSAAAVGVTTRAAAGRSRLRIVTGQAATRSGRDREAVLSEKRS